MRDRFRYATVIGCLVFGAGCGEDPERRAQIEDWMLYRSARDRFIGGPQGPLRPEDRARFKGLAYYKPNFDLLFEAELHERVPADTVQMLTSRNTFDPFLGYAVFRFEYAGTACSLVVFKALHNEQLFLPFTDATSGADTYGAGRYVDLHPVSDTTWRLDFNVAYNPNCAYNPEWICPIAPAENRLPFAVQAGEKNYPGGSH